MKNAGNNKAIKIHDGALARDLASYFLVCDINQQAVG